MSGDSPSNRVEPLVSLPSGPIPYVVIVAALVSAGIHLLLAPRVMGFDQTTGILFILNGVGWIGIILVYLSRYWRRDVYLLTAGYALATIVAFFAMEGRVNTMSILSKSAEVVVLGTTLYLYRTEDG